MQLLGAAYKVLDLNLQVYWWQWTLLGLGFLSLILFDLFILHRNDNKPLISRTLLKTSGWVAVGIGLGVLIYLSFGLEAAGQYFSGYLVELSLSIDNVFTWSVILTYFAIPKKYQHRVLFWGVIGALILRTIFVFAGIALIERFESVLVIFGLILFWSGYKLLKTDQEHKYDPHNSRFFKLIKLFIPVSKKLDGHKLFTREKGKRVATMLFMALLVVEFTDVIFAVDSVPAILAVSHEPFIIVAASAAAMLGMRSLYFVFDTLRDKFWLLNHALGILLLFVGAKMFIAPTEILGFTWFNIHISTNISLIVISVLVATGMIGSLIIKNPKRNV